MKKTLLLICCLLAVSYLLSAQQKAIVNEMKQTMPTYPFSDPDPVANPSALYYPYFRFDGFSDKAMNKEWKVVEMENDYIKVTLFPEIGGKIWGAVDKTTGKEFIYHNHVVKFRDIAMRGPWTSGGIEFNFGIIGHVPTSSTPIDYITKEKTDGSVSCYISSYELITRTWWTVEVNLPKEKAYFTTNTTWHNSSGIDQPYYQWMNAGYKADGNIEFCYPGTNYIGHGGELHPFPMDEEGRDLSWYEKNDFGNSKSYHVLGKYNDFYGAYWHNDDFGSVHHADYNDKLGMKIFLWGLSREGGIWEDLLTDADGQYVELQSGRMYNQPSSGSAFTPFKHTPFAPLETDRWTEYWFPVKETKGISKAAPTGALHIIREEGLLKLRFSPNEKLSTDLKVYLQDKLIESFPIHTEPLNTLYYSIPLDKINGKIKVVIGKYKLVYSEEDNENLINRPKETPADFDTESAYGLYVQGEQWLHQKVHDKARVYLQASLDKDPYFIPALSCLASLNYRQGKYEQALSLCKKALRINTYDGQVNYMYGLCNLALGNITDAKDGFSVASISTTVRSAAFAKLGEIKLREKEWDKAAYYATKSLEYNKENLSALNIMMVSYRKSGQPEKANTIIQELLDKLPLYHFARFESMLSGGESSEHFCGMIRNELPHETYMELAEWYENTGCTEEAIELLSFVPNHPIACYRRARLLDLTGNSTESMEMLRKANSLSPEGIFPFRASTLNALQWAASSLPDWKIDYYAGLIYWENDDKEKARACLNKINDSDYAPFYLSRSLLREGKDKLNDILTAERINKSWRTGFALMNYYTDRQDWEEARLTGEKYSKMYPSNYYLGLKYAKALCETGRYKACIWLLKTLNVLPNEGSYAGRAVYREANLYEAIDYLNKKQYDKCLKSIEQSKQWPENLGVGKPYDEMIDDRLENYLQAKAYIGKNNLPQAEMFMTKVETYKSPRSRFQSANLLNALAMHQSGNKEEADKLVDSWSKQYPDNKTVQWCISVYRGEQEKALTLLSSRNEPGDTTPWETSFRDTDFNLIIKIFSDK